MGIVAIILNKDKTVADRKCFKGRTAFGAAAMNGHCDICEYLQQNYKININSTEYAGHTALMLAAMVGHVNVVQFLMKCGADATIRNNSGKDALAIAKEAKHYEVVKLLPSKWKLFSNSK